MPFALDETFVRRTEEQLGALLPDSYRRCMMTSSGGDQLVFLRSGDVYGPAVHPWSHATAELAR